MQEALLLQTLIAPASAAPANAQAGAPLNELVIGSELFSQLLSGFGAGPDGQSGQQFAGGRGQILPQRASAALAAQGLEMPDVMPAAIDLELVITPEQAQPMLDRLHQWMQHPSTKDPAPLEAIAKQLQQIVDSDEPKSLAHVLEDAPEVSEMKLGALLSGLLQLVRKDKSAEQDVANEEEAPGQMFATMQQWPAMMFHADHAARAGTQAAAAHAKKKEREFVETVAVVQPLSFTQAAPVEEVAESALALPAALDDRIPPMLSPDQMKKENVADASSASDLPDVSLPKMAHAVEQVEANFDDRTTSMLRKDDHLGAVAALEGGVSEVSYPTSVATASHSHAAAAKVIDLVPTPGLINHAPIKEQVHVAISQAAKDGMDNITIQLDPAELGRVEVKLQTSREGLTQIFFMVDKPETFDSLSRDARQLERSLQEAGVKADTGSMQFNLRQQPQQQSDMQGGQGKRSGKPSDSEDEKGSQRSASGGIAPLSALTRNYLINIREGVDISA